MTCTSERGAPTAPNTDLVRQLTTGDQAAWEELVNRYDRRLYGIARSFRLDPATSQDVVQTAWLRLVEKLHTVRDLDRISSWLVTTVRRQALSAVRGSRQSPDLVGYGMDVPDPGRQPDEEAAAQDRDARVRAALGRLPDRDQRLLTLLVSAPARSYQALSTELRMPVGSIGPTRARSLDRLRQAFATAGVNEELLCS
jgi:RNA polymerase sigma factor (sigma-70 family)